MKRLSHKSRTIFCAAVVAGGVAVAGGVTYAAVPSADGEISACYGKSGFVRIIDAEEGEGCLPSEQAISWRQQAETVRGYRMSRATPHEVEITVVGEGPIGFPAENGTHVLELQLPQGVYHVDASIAVRKAFGSGDFLCWVHDGNVFTIFTRASLGDAPGHVKRTTVAGAGFFNIPAGGGTLTLECWQAPIPEVPGSPSGENPTVFYAVVHALSVSNATLTRYPSGDTTYIP